MKKIDLNLLKIHELKTEDINSILNIQKELDIQILSKQNILKDLTNSHFKYFVIKSNRLMIRHIH